MAFVRFVFFLAAGNTRALAVSLSSAAADARLLATEAVAANEILVSHSLLQAGETLTRWGARHDLEVDVSGIPVEPHLLQVGSTLQSWGKPVLAQVEVQASGASGSALLQVGRAVVQEVQPSLSGLQGWGAQLPSHAEIPAADGASFLQASASLERWGGKWRPSSGISLLQMAPEEEESEVVDQGEEDSQDPGASLAELLAPTDAPSGEDRAGPFRKRLPESMLVLPLRYIGLLCVLMGMAAALLREIATGCVLTASPEAPQLKGGKGGGSPRLGVRTVRTRSSEKVGLPEVMQQCTDRGS